MKTRAVKTCVVVSDLHAGCQLGLCPPVVRLDEGGDYRHTACQAKVWARWLDFCVWARIEADNGPFHFVVNGDAINGVPHGAISNWTNNITDQRRCAESILKPLVMACHRSGGQFYMLRGTESHVGKSGEAEEELAQTLGAVKNDAGQASRYDLWLNMAGYLVHFLHHIGTCSSAAYESSAVMSEISAMLNDAAINDERVPNVIIRSHRHRPIEVRKTTPKGIITAAVTAGWQLKTPFAFRIAGARVSQPVIGGLVVKVGDEGIYTKQRTWKLDRPKIES